MRLTRHMPFFVLLLVGVFAATASGAGFFPIEELENAEILDMNSPRLLSWSEFSKTDLQTSKRNRRHWSTLNRKNVPILEVCWKESSALKNTSVRLVVDGKMETAWAEGVKGYGIGEWISIDVTRYAELEVGLGGSLTGIGIIPGCGKDSASWNDNGRLKTATLIVCVPRPWPPQAEVEDDEFPETSDLFFAYRLHFHDTNKLHYFDLRSQDVSKLFPTWHLLWLRIDEVYVGKKSTDTYVSEVVLVGEREL